MFPGIASDSVALQADGASIAYLLQDVEEGLNVEGSAVERLDVPIPTGLGVLDVGAVDGHGPKSGLGFLEERSEVAAWVDSQPVTEVEHDPNFGAVDFFGNAAGVFDSFDP